MANIHEQLSAHYDPSESSDLIGRDINKGDCELLKKIVKEFAPKLGLHPVGDMLEPTPILTAEAATKASKKSQSFIQSISSKLKNSR